MRLWAAAVGLLITAGAFGAEEYGFRVYLKDKGDAGCSVDAPEAFLSREAIDRRLRDGKFIDESDLPIAPAYLDTLRLAGVCPVVQSRWFSTVVVASADSAAACRLKSLSIVDSVKWVWKGVRETGSATAGVDTSTLYPADTPLKSPYGYAAKQIELHNGVRLHEAGYRGKGMRVAVIDAGFLHADRIEALKHLNIAGTKNIVFPSESVFEGDEHGTKALSCLGADLPGWMTGTAPDATYWLIQSEDVRSEYPIEEDYWIAAVEFADSVGVQVISSSLGYFTFDSPELDYNTDLLDGKTALISRAAEKAAGKGILLFISAGNEGSGDWRKITFPSDAEHVVTVGSVTEEKEKSVFSSVGFTADARVKPDVVSLGTATTVIDATGNIRFANGTSFATPVLAGLGICLWQALPWLSNTEVITLLQQASSQHKRPDIELGYGIPDVYQALKKGRQDAWK